RQRFLECWGCKAGSSTQNFGRHRGQDSGRTSYRKPCASGMAAAGRHPILVAHPKNQHNNNNEGQLWWRYFLGVTELNSERTGRSSVHHVLQSPVTGTFVSCY